MIYSKKQYFARTILLMLGFLSIGGTSWAQDQVNISNLSEITDLAGNYKLSGDVDASGLSASLDKFTGTLDGGLHKITGLSVPLFASTENAVIRNVVFEGVNISKGDTDGDAGAVTSKAAGATRIYNCGILPGFSGSSISGTGNVGGLVGTLRDSARVVNCYSYANITGGTNKGGIVGNNTVASTQSSLTTMVMNCMFYGDIEDGGKISPIYGGTEINNVAGGMNNYNYYRYRSPYSVNKKITAYNRALAMEEKFINRFERYRLLLNSNKKLAAKYASTTTVTVSPDDMAKWVLATADRSISNPNPYPVLKAQGKYPSIINYDAEHAPDSASVGRLNGGKLGSKTLTVTISTKSQRTTGGQSWPKAASSDVQMTSLTLIRTDKDTVRYNFNYDKVQLPYYNDVGTGNYTESRVVTGWKITSITGGTPGTYREADEWGGYNFADRNCTDKDLYSVSKRVFSQGAYWDVPNGVTAITIEPYWAIANYVSDEKYDVVYNSGYTAQIFKLFGTQYSNNKTIDIYGDGSKDQIVYTSISAARAGFNNTDKTVYDQAVVLVGNVHQYANPTNDNIPYTVMSIDMDHDNEPDYSYIFTHDNRKGISPIRYDFLNIMGLAEAQIPKGASLLRNVSIFNLRGWFEITNTCIVNFSQFEYDNNKDSNGGVTKSLAPLILLGGTFEQLVSTQKTKCQDDDGTKHTKYIHIGSNAWCAKFGTGTHSDGKFFTPHVPVSVTGGDYDEFYLSGTYQPNISNMTSDNAECYVSGGRFGEMAGASLEAIKGDVRWDINWADITNFYGGGVNGVNPITGDIRVDMTNSHVNQYCGGPKFGDMSNGKTVITNATGCEFGTYFGAGYGGNAYNRVKYWDEPNKDPGSLQEVYTTDRGKYYDGNATNANSGHPNYGKKGKGVATDFDYDFFIWSTGVTGSRFYVKFVTFSLATTRDVTSNLSKCKVTGNVYGGGKLGKVAGDVSTTLTDCTIDGSVFGAGFSATLPTVDVRKAPAFISGKEPKKNMNIGMFEPGELNETEVYEWKHVDAMPANGNPGIKEDNKYVYTTEDLSYTNLGSVSGKASLTLDGTTVGGSVFGGGEQSAVNNNDEPTKASTEVTIMGNSQISGNVFGGGNEGDVSGNTSVDMSSGFVHDRVYGGGKLGSVGTFTTTTAVAGHTAHEGCIGKPNGRTGETGVCSVSISGGQVGRADMRMPEDFGYVFGASRGALADPEVDKDIDFRAYVYETNVTISGTAFIVGGVYGGSENGRVLNDTHVNIQGGQIGCGEGMSGPYSEEQFINPLTTEVTETNALAECSHWNYVYPYRPHDVFKLDEHGAEVPATDGHTFYGNVFGGGSGYFPYKEQTLTQEQIDAGLSTGIWLRSAGLVEGDTYVNITGGHILTSVYGGNELTDVIGTCHVSISGGTIGVPRTIQQIIEHPVTCYVYGAGKGDQRLNFNEWTNVGGVEVEVSGGIIYGSVFGGGEDGHVLKSVNMAIKNNSDPSKSNPVIGTWGTSYVDGNVFGAGRGFGGDALTAGTVSGNITIDIQGGTMLGSIYGGGRLGSVGTYLVPHDHANYGQEIPDGYEQVIGADNPDVVAEGVTHGNITINISGGTIGNNYEYVPNPSAADKSKMPLTSFDYRNRLTYTKGGNVFAGGMGRLYGLDGSTLLPHWADQAKAKNTVVRISGGTIKSNVYGGAEMGTLAGNATIHVTGGTIGTTIGTGDAAYRYGSVFGGGKGSTENLPGIKQAGQINGNVLVELNHGVADDAKGGIVNQIFGCNDMNGSPKGTVTVHVYATQGEGEAALEDKVAGRYDVEAVYGGGNLAPYEPTAATGTEEEKAQAYAHVIIDGCHLTSIHQVYGGGNAASTPASLVDIYGTFEVEEAFGGGNGKGKLPSGTDNPGANVGYHDFSAFEASSDPTTGAATKALREANYSYGSGKASMNIHGGRIHRVYGGSNTKGNIRSVAVTMLEDVTGCPFNVDEAYGGGKSAPMDAESRLEMACIPGLKAAYGGAEDAEIDGNVTLNITNGTFDRIFGGNNVSGHIRGTITVNIEETGCKPIIIGQLYGGGNQAPYEAPAGQHGPTLNVHSFTSIGEIYGGGYGEPATVTGDPYINVDVCEGLYKDGFTYADGSTTNDKTGTRIITFVEYKRAYNAETLTWDFVDEDSNGERDTETKNMEIYLPPHTAGKIGAINRIFGGGNAAPVVGNTYVNIGTHTGESIVFNTPVVKTVTTGEGEGAVTTEEPTTDLERTHSVIGVDIRDNIFGGGNEAEVSGDTHVTIGKKAE